ncbi:hypothetical protein IKF02_00040 [Candidatus Saccharibacteria bacterium]|nr:hypothetical protein [Candidatus Saccharibacteria bacterium]
MRVSEYYNLGVNQPSLDFVDVDLCSDSCLFIDPAALNNDKAEWGLRCCRLIKDYFSHVLSTMHEGDNKKARALLKELCEPSETKLGFSKNKTNGRGIGEKLAVKMWHALKESVAIKSGMIEDIEDTILLIEGISSDMISDIVTNIIREPLIEYTQTQFDQFGVELEVRKSKKIWNPQKRIWETKSFRQPVVVIDGREDILTLVPKSIVRREATYSADEYFNKYIVARLQQEDVADGLVRILKTTGEQKLPYKKDVLSRRGIENKKHLKMLNYDYTTKYPDLLAQYKKEKNENPSPALMHQDFTDYMDTPPVDYDLLLNRVLETMPGRDNAKYYETAILALFNALFYPYLARPNYQARINNGGKIVDIVYSNVDKDDFFWWLGQHFNAPYVYIECKNYNDDIGNPEIDQLSGRFGPDKGEFGISVSRRISNRTRINKMCIDAMIDNHGYIIALDDNDLRNLVDAAKIAPLGHRLDLLHEKFDDLVFRNNKQGMFHNNET